MKTNENVRKTEQLTKAVENLSTNINQPEETTTTTAALQKKRKMKLRTYKIINTSSAVN